MKIRNTMKDGAVGDLLFALPSASSSPMLFTIIIGKRTQYLFQYPGYYSRFSSGFISGWDDAYAFIRLIPTGSMTMSEFGLGQWKRRTVMRRIWPCVYAGCCLRCGWFWGVVYVGTVSMTVYDVVKQRKWQFTSQKWHVQEKMKALFRQISTQAKHLSLWHCKTIKISIITVKIEVS